MLLRYWIKGDYKRMIGAGQVTMIVAWLILLTAYWLHTRPEPALHMVPMSIHFWKGLCTGLGITLALFSIVLNVRGMIGLKQSNQT